MAQLVPSTGAPGGPPPLPADFVARKKAALAQAAPAQPPPLPPDFVARKQGEGKGPEPPPLPWEKVSHYPGYQAHGKPGGTWIPVGSSNVEAIRWVDGRDYPLQVRFLAKGMTPATEYEYQVPFEVYDNMFAASSQGRYVWGVLRKGGYPYRKMA